MSRRRSFHIGAVSVVLAAAAVVASCDSGPKAGDITATLATQHTQLGSVMFEVTATSPNTVEGLTAACSGCRAFLSRISDTSVRGIVTGPFGPGPLVHVTVSDRKLLEAYSIQILELARTDYRLEALAGSSLQFPAR
jgi:hypothetical protein